LPGRGIHPRIWKAGAVSSPHFGSQAGAKGPVLTVAAMGKRASVQPAVLVALEALLERRFQDTPVRPVVPRHQVH
jgi:hypothetical protein